MSRSTTCKRLSVAQVFSFLLKFAKFTTTLKCNYGESCLACIRFLYNITRWNVLFNNLQKTVSVTSALLIWAYEAWQVDALKYNFRYDLKLLTTGQQFKVNCSSLLFSGVASICGTHGKSTKYPPGRKHCFWLTPYKIFFFFWKKNCFTTHFYVHSLPSEEKPISNHTVPLWP